AAARIGDPHEPATGIGILRPRELPPALLDAPADHPAEHVAVEQDAHIPARTPLALAPAAIEGPPQLPAPSARAEGHPKGPAGRIRARVDMQAQARTELDACSGRVESALHVDVSA